MDEPGGQSLKEATGRSSRGKVEEDKQTDKAVNETLVYHRMRQGKAKRSTGKKERREAAERRESNRGEEVNESESGYTRDRKRVQWRGWLNTKREQADIHLLATASPPPLLPIPPFV